MVGGEADVAGAIAGYLWYMLASSCVASSVESGISGSRSSSSNVKSSARARADGRKKITSLINYRISSRDASGLKEKKNRNIFNSRDGDDGENSYLTRHPRRYRTPTLSATNLER